MTDTTERADNIAASIMATLRREGLLRDGSEAQDQFEATSLAPFILANLATPQPMGEDAVERVALNEIAAAVGETLDKDFGFWSEPGRTDRRIKLYSAWENARTAIAAMPQSTTTVEAGDALREAREALKKARRETFVSESSGVDFNRPARMRRVRAHIDAALAKLDGGKETGK